jgi:bacterioferritin-associated ferredoxin
VCLCGGLSPAGISNFIRAIPQAYKNPRSSINAEAIPRATPGM